MEKVLSIRERIRDKRRIEQMEAHRNRLEAVQRVLQCSSCHLRCAMCGHHFRPSAASYPAEASGPGFVLCECCRLEFEDFQKIRKREDAPEIFWHNEEWLRLWSAWLDYQEAMGRFRNSEEVKTLTVS